MSRTLTRTGALGAAAVALAFSLPAHAIEYPIGAPQEAGGMEVGAVFLQSVTMEPDGMMLAADQSDIHLEADIHALADNKNGFAEGEWMPYLQVKYTLTKEKTGETQSGMLMPMVASDGPHYGDNVKLMGVGKYKLTFDIAPPGAEFGRHVDKETGVAAWFAPFTTTYEFIFSGVGKKGAY
ncbi:iron transporter [Roseibium aggregatum]|uniref:Iron transporter n=1 Tax=Roseibium aggregatum TaxID=187304 RepID=A0A926NX58_9HYPH|nr:iron transporter [Roseibium aggregatum]MBD1548044.1 iron transporter [Roseibium aggregatum]